MIRLPETNFFPGPYLRFFFFFATEIVHCFGGRKLRKHI